MILLQPPRPRRVLVACCSVPALSATGCASHVQTAPEYRETAPAGSTEATVREEFDPVRFREDLILIQPVFPPPTVNPGPVEPVIAVNAATWWMALRDNGINDKLQGFGSLLRDF